VKLCWICNKKKPKSRMESFTRNSKTYTRSRCLKCNGVRAEEWRRENPERYMTSWKSRDARRKKLRASGEFPERWILIDSRRSDKRNGRKNNLTLEFIKKEILKGCTYCGDTVIRMTLDRIDNDKGHLTSNVVPACIRCNYARGDMPYKAWLCLATGMKRARKNGLFGKWTGRCR
jgi:hypothetical protein